MQPHSSLFETLFKRNLASDGNKEFLEQVANEYPFFAPAQFYLLNSVKDDPEEFSKQSAKAAVLFNNPFWLNFQLEKLAHENKPSFVPQVEQPYDMLSGKEEYSTVSIEEQREEMIAQSEEPEQETINNIEHSIPEEEEQSVTVYENAPEEILTAGLSENEEQITPAIEEKTETIQTEPVQSQQEIQLEKHSEDLLFEPLHVTDYFASQGIKLSDELQPIDKLGKQLKSFTEWLKTMKRIHVAPQNNDVETDHSVETLAEKSNAEDEIITETMAEVLVHQGRNTKAIDVYKKLSLLNPAKSAYFAARINQLTEI